MPAVIATAKNRFKDVFNYEELRVVQSSIVNHKSLNISYVHNFHDLNLDEQIDHKIYEEQQSKVLYLARKQMMAYSDSLINTLYVRAGATMDECAEFCEILKNIYGANNFKILNVNLNENPRGLIDICDNMISYEITDVVNKSIENKWTGDDAAWQQVLRKFKIK